LKLDAKSIIHEISASLEKISPVHESEPLIPRYLPGTSNSYLKPSDCHYPRQAALLLVRKWRNHLICSKKGHCYNWIYGYPLGHFMKQCESFTRIFYLRDTPGGEWLPIDPWKKLIDLISSTNITTARFRRERFGRRNSRSREQVKEAVFIFYAGRGGVFMIPSAQEIVFPLQSIRMPDPAVPPVIPRMIILGPIPGIEYALSIISLAFPLKTLCLSNKTRQHNQPVLLDHINAQGNHTVLIGKRYPCSAVEDRRFRLFRSY
jgi:hypothetical protein